MKKILKHLKENWIRHGFETLVVVVGVLIAFTLNNWNESRRNDEEARQLIRALSSDLALDTTLLHNWIDISEKELEKVANMDQRIQDPKANLDTIIQIARYEYLPVFQVLNELNSITFNSLESTGKIELLDPDLKTELLYHNVRKRQLSKDLNTEGHSKMAIEFTQKYRFDTSGKDNYISNIAWRIEDERDFVIRFSSLLGYHNYKLRTHNSLYQELLDETKRMLSLLDSIENQ